MAAKHLGIFMALPCKMMDEGLERYKSSLIPVFDSKDKIVSLGDDVRMAEIIWDSKIRKRLEDFKKLNPGVLIAVKLPITKESDEEIIGLMKAGCSVFDLEGTYNGRSAGDQSRYAKDDIRSIHQALVREGVRNEVTLLASGGFAMAEHVAKALICGVDGVFIDFPILIALECRMCQRCRKGLSCPVKIEEAPSKWVASRTVNIMGAWHNQLLEIMGAMGIRECRRLRGEAGRAMFFEELDREIFGSMDKLEEGLELE